MNHRPYDSVAHTTKSHADFRQQNEHKEIETHHRWLEEFSYRNKATGNRLKVPFLAHAENQNIFLAPDAVGSESPLNSDASEQERIERAMKDLRRDLAVYADEAATHLHTIGDCAHGPRLAFEKLGLKLPPVVATEQGAAVRGSGMFDEIPRSDVRPGDYGVRDWNAALIQANHGVNMGDSFIVTNVDNNGQLFGANDHHFVVPDDGPRYSNLKFYRLNENFLHVNPAIDFAQS